MYALFFIDRFIICINICTCVFQDDRLLPIQHVSVLVSHLLHVVIPGFGSKQDATTDLSLMVVVMLDIDSVYLFFCDIHAPHCNFFPACSFFPHMMVPLVVIWFTDVHNMGIYCYDMKLLNKIPDLLMQILDNWINVVCIAILSVLLSITLQHVKIFLLHILKYPARKSE